MQSHGTEECYEKFNADLVGCQNPLPQQRFRHASTPMLERRLVAACLGYDMQNLTCSELRVKMSGTWDVEPEMS